MYISPVGVIAAVGEYRLLKEKMLERDPNGVAQHALGAKLDAGKLMSGVILGQFSNALTAVSAVGTFGAKKYSVGGWKHVENGLDRYEDAKLRHWLKRMGGEVSDPDSQMLHLAHEAWNALAILELYLQTEGKA